MFTEDEKRFLDALEAALVAARKSPAVNITRMADKALSVRSRHGYLCQCNISTPDKTDNLF